MNTDTILARVFDNFSFWPKRSVWQWWLMEKSRFPEKDQGQANWENSSCLLAQAQARRTVWGERVHLDRARWLWPERHGPRRFARLIPDVPHRLGRRLKLCCPFLRHTLSELSKREEGKDCKHIRSMASLDLCCFSTMYPKNVPCRSFQYHNQILEYRSPNPTWKLDFIRKECEV